jgi:Zn-dependent protease
MKTLMLLFAAGKFGKFLISGGSMLIAIGTYTIIYGWKYAVGFVFLLLIHELGHYIAAGKRGLPVGLPTFIPFVGAWIELKEKPMDAETEAFVAIAGPILGSAAAFICYLIAKETNEGIFLALAYAGFMLNLFNLIPLSPLDGGRVMAAISPKLWFIGLPMLIGLFIWKPSPMIILIGLFALPQLWNAFTNRSLLESQYYQVPNNIKVNYAIQYLALVIFLTVLTIETHDSLSSVRSSY